MGMCQLSFTQCGISCTGLLYTHLSLLCVLWKVPGKVHSAKRLEEEKREKNYSYERARKSRIFTPDDQVHPCPKSNCG